MQQVCEFKKSIEKRLGSHCMKRLIPVLTESPMATLHRSMLLLASRASRLFTRSLLWPALSHTTNDPAPRLRQRLSPRHCAGTACRESTQERRASNSGGQLLRQALIQHVHAQHWLHFCGGSLAHWNGPKKRRGAVCSKTHSSKMHRWYVHYI